MFDRTGGQPSLSRCAKKDADEDTDADTDTDTVTNTDASKWAQAHAV